MSWLEYLLDMLLKCTPNKTQYFLLLCTFQSLKLLHDNEFLTYPFKIFIYRSIGYIYLKYIGPYNLTSLCTTRWTMMSQKDEGKNIFNSHKITKISSSSSSNFTRSVTLQQMKEKNEHGVMVSLTFFDKIPWIVIDNNCCMNMWQSWNFN